MKREKANFLAQSDKGFSIKEIIFKTKIVWNFGKDSLYETIRHSYKISASHSAHFVSAYNKAHI